MSQIYPYHQHSAREKFTHLHPNTLKSKGNVSISIKHRQRIVSTALISGDDSLIRVNGRDHYRQSLKNKTDRNEDEDQIVLINVCGSRYQTRLSTLKHYPQTLLGNEDKRKDFWNPVTKEYFFDRHRACFEAILYYYQSNGRLRRPDYVPLDTFLEEVAFFQLGPQAMAEINQLENVSFVKHIDLPNGFWRRYIWFYLEYPQHSIIARIIYLLSMFLTALSCVSLAVETLPQYNKNVNEACHTEINGTNSSSSSSNAPVCTLVLSSPFFIIQTVCVVYFTVEFLLRLISTPSYLRFALSFLNWIDLGAIVPYFVVLALSLSNRQVDLGGGAVIGLRLLRLLRFLRLVKIHLIFKQLKSLRVLSSTLKESFVDFIIMITILTLIAFLFGAATYFAEQNANGSAFDSIPKATYWGILTITTVGYGDMYPITAIGRVLACLCALVGAGTIGMLVSVLVDRYQRVYNRKKFYPEQVISPVDAADAEHDEKEDFIRRKLNGLKRNPSNQPAFFPTLALHPPSPVVRQTSKPSSSSHVRFIISLTNEKLVDQLMRELTEAIGISGEQMHLKLVSDRGESL